VAQHSFKHTKGFLSEETKPELHPSYVFKVLRFLMGTSGPELTTGLLHSSEQRTAQTSGPGSQTEPSPQ